jgi:hypothetical protein
MLVRFIVGVKRLFEIKLLEMSADYFAVLRLNSSVRVNAEYTPKQKNMQ